jgi:hypothetical protein
MSETAKKGVSDEAKAMAKEIRDRFVKFVTDEGLSEVSEKTGCNYQALRNSAVTGYNPSLETICQVKIGYGDEFDDVYVFTGKRFETVNKDLPTVQSSDNSQIELLNQRLAILQDKLTERENQILELKMDKMFLKDLIKKQQ